jgi:hypothetical protein
MIAVDQAVDPKHFFAAMVAQHPDGFGYVEPLELAWGLASPLVGCKPEHAVALALETLATEPSWRLAVLAGIPLNGAASRALQQQLPRGWGLRQGQPSARHHASLDAERGAALDGFLQRRSVQFRKSLAKSIRKARTAGIEFVSEIVDADNCGAQFERILQCEQQSWKGRDAVGMSVDAMQEFYRHMMPMLAATGAARLMFARYGDRDIAYVFGARFGTTYRGLQFSYHDDFSAYSLGSLGQYYQIVALIDEGVTLYDLGSEMDYKRRWAEREFVTTAHLVIR